MFLLFIVAHPYPSAQMLDVDKKTTEMHSSPFEPLNSHLILKDISMECVIAGRTQGRTRGIEQAGPDTFGQTQSTLYAVIGKEILGKIL